MSIRYLMRPGALAAVAAGLIVLLAPACSDSGGEKATATPTSSEPAVVHVVTTLDVFADLIRHAGKERVEVTVVLPDGLDPDISDFAQELIDQVREGDLVLYNGLDLEGPAEDLLFRYKRRDTQIISYARDVESPTHEGMSAVDARDNPYLWLDPLLALTYLDTSWDSLAIVDGDATNTYRENATEYRSELASLHERLKDQLDAIPEQNRKLASVHDAFFHLANRYGLEPVNLPTPVSTEEPSPRRIEELEAVLRAQAVPAIFAEKGFESNLLREAASRAGVEVCYLYSDTLDDAVTTYVEMMEFNAAEMVRCLGG